MSKVIAIMTMSLDGYVADRNGGVAEVMGWYMHSGDTEVQTGGSAPMTLKMSEASARHFCDLTSELGAVLATVAWTREIDEAGHRGSLLVSMRFEPITGSPQHQPALKCMMRQVQRSFCQRRTEMRLIGDGHAGPKRFEQYWREHPVDDVSVKPRPRFA